MAGFGWLSRTVTGVTTRAEDSSAMCLFAALGLLAPRLILVLMWLFNSSFVLQPFAGMAVPNPVLPIAGLLLLPTTTLGFCWATSAFGGVSSFSGMLVVAIGVIIDLGLIGNGRGLAKR
jgi:hypothetical protein|tara:strand:+ start:364 stop:720 length:357 start_codon:yes stop_codon:yes gene_type:complete